MNYMFRESKIIRTHFLDFVEKWHTQEYCKWIIPDNPVVTIVKFIWKLCNSCRPCVWELHRPGRWCCVRHVYKYNCFSESLSLQFKNRYVYQYTQYNFPTLKDSQLDDQK